MSSTMAAKLTSRIDNLVADVRVPGIGMIAVDKSGNQIYSHAAGNIVAGDANSPPFTNDTPMIFWSCTKFLTSIAILQLLELGKISSLDDAVSNYLPQQGKVEVITHLDAQDKPQIRSQAKEMKVIHLLTHTSGYTYDFWDKLMFDYRQTKNQPQGAYVGMGARWHFEDIFLEFDPGQRYNYGLSIDILGFIVEKLSGQSLPDYVRQNITDPLGMTRSGPYLEGNDWLRCHFKSSEGQLTAQEAVVPAKEPYKFGGGHYIVSTLNDYSQVLLAMLNEGAHPVTKSTILKPETVQKYVFQDYIPHVGCSADGIGVVPVSLVPGLSNAGEMLKGQRKGWSCGLMLNLDDVPEGRRARSGAWAGLGNIYFWIDPTAGKAGIFGTNILPFLDHDCVDVFEDLERVAYST